MRIVNTIDVKKLSEDLGIPVVPISAGKNEGISELLDVAMKTAADRILSFIEEK